MELTSTRGDGPKLICHTIVAYHCDVIMQRDRGTDVTRESEERRANRNRIGGRRFKHKMFFAMPQQCRVRDLRDCDTRIEWHLGGYRFVSEVQAEPIATRFADNPCHDRHRNRERQIAVVAAVATIPEDRCSWGAFIV